MCGRSAAGRTLVPSCQLLKEADANDAHGPLEVLRPCSDDGRKRDSAQANKGLRLEVAKERHGICSDVGSGVGVSQARGDCRCNKTQARDDGGDPCDGLLIDRVAVGQFGFDTGKLLVGGLVLDLDAHEQIQVGDGVGDSCQGQQGHNGGSG